MKRLYLVFIVPIVLSCTMDTMYTYVQLNEEEGIDGYIREEPKEFIAQNDSLAYLEGYKNLAIAQKVANKMREQHGYDYPKRPSSFLIYNSKDELVSDPIPKHIGDSLFRIIEARVNSD